MTLGQLAEILGLSKATVSYALRNSPMVSAATQKRVQKRARELGYSPNPIASAFLQQVRSQGSNRYQANLAFLVPPNVHYSNLTKIQNGAQERAAELGYGLDIIPCEKEYGSARLTKLLVARGILGIVIGPLAKVLSHLELDWSKFASATYGYSMDRPALHRVVHHHCHGLRTAFRMCRRKGFKRIGFALSTESELRSDRLWSAGYLGLQYALPPAERVNLLLVPLAKWTPDAVEKWILQEKPDMVLFHATGCLPEMERLLKNLPFKVSYAVLGLEPGDECAGIDQQSNLSGRLLVDLLSSQIQHNDRGIPRHPTLSMINGAWIDHPSCVPPTGDK